MRPFPLLLALALLAPPALPAQGYPPSQRSVLVQHVAHTTVTVAYGRPIARGRALFGALVPWDAVWHPGADSATRIVFSRDVEIEGRVLKAGAYSLWLIPRERAPWTVIFSSAANVFHKPYPGEAKDALRVDAAPDSASHMESMGIYFPMVRADSAVMRIHWGTTALPLRVRAPYAPR